MPIISGRVVLRDPVMCVPCPKWATGHVMQARGPLCSRPSVPVGVLAARFGFARIELFSGGTVKIFRGKSFV